MFYLKKGGGVHGTVIAFDPAHTKAEAFDTGFPVPSFVS